MFIGSGFGLCVIPTEWEHSGNFDENIIAAAKFEYCSHCIKVCSVIESALQ